ncbi:hypothetical protein OROGR_025476 [Orobanche gracilis]
MDIPDLEELEWLESHTIDDNQFDDEFDLDIEPPSPPSSDKSPKKSPLLLPQKPSPLQPLAKRKRVRSDFTKSISLDEDQNDDSYLDKVSSDGKRSRTEYDGALNENQSGPEGPYMGPVESEERSAGVDPPKVVPPMENNGGSFCDDEVDDEWLRYSRPTAVVEEMEVVVEGDREDRILSRYATEIDGDCVPITGLDGERVYAKICGVEMDEEKQKNLSVRGHFNGGLLQEPVRVLMQKAEHDELTKALKESVDGAPTAVAPPKAPATDEKLWVDKYAPNTFTELLSDEQINREVLLWLKQWDSCVFGSEIKSTTDDVLTSLRQHSSGSQHSKSFTKSYFRNNKETRLNRDTWRHHDRFDKGNSISQGIQEIWDKRHKCSGPPEQKILLLSGSPGLGKTTLAHVAARHCGYRVVEFPFVMQSFKINASDDRSSFTLEAKILDVVQMNSVISDSKPKCLVIDEIDGALVDGKGAVEIILQLVSAERKIDSGKETVAEGKSSRKKQKNSVLLRPVICICNDLYAPALRPLRQVAKVHIFVRPSVSRVVNRLKYICNKESIKTSSIALSALAEYTECDIRSCLNTLQFLNNKKESLNVLEISSQVVGRKDVSKSAFDIWKEIFRKRKKKQERNSNNFGSSMSKEFEFLYSMISNRGDYDLILDGVHENILQLCYVDPVMQKTVQCLDSLVVSDITHRYILRTQQMFLQVYQPPIAIFIHSLAPNIFSRKDGHVPHMAQPNITKYFEASVNKILCRRLSFSDVAYSVTASPETVVALHLLSDNEKRDLVQLVNNMVSYAITYKKIQPDRNLSHEDALDAAALSFDPPIGEFIHFKGYNACHFDLALAVKHVLIHEVEKQKILQSSHPKSADLRMENHASVKDTGSGQSSKSSYTNGSAVNKMYGKSLTIQKSALSVSSKSPVSESGGGSTPMDKVKSVERTKKPSGSLASFFDRFRKVNSEGSGITNVVLESRTLKRDSHPLLFKFNEGFTNAVKRPVRVREFLL